jgi:CBS domain containing-hemolysin-like protein
MLSAVVILTLAVLSLLFAAMLAAWHSVTPSFVRFWARTGDSIAGRLYPLKARGMSVVVLLELLRALSLTGAVILLARELHPFIAWLAASSALVLVSLLLPQVYLKPAGMRLLASLSGAIKTVDTYLAPVTRTLGTWLDRNVANEPPMALTKTEMTRLIDSTHPDDTDLTTDELRLLKHALNFGDKSVRAVMTPKRVMVTVKHDEVLSPALLDELHKSGHSRFPVTGDDGNEIIGILYVRDLIDLHDNTHVSGAMRKTVYYVHEERELDHVLQAFLRTKHHLFIVTNVFAEVTGLITIEDVLEQVIGKSIMDEFDEYHDLRAVAAKQAKEAIKAQRHADRGALRSAEETVQPAHHHEPKEHSEPKERHEPSEAQHDASSHHGEHKHD